jgi:predicted nucleotidyltransferase
MGASEVEMPLLPDPYAEALRCALEFVFSNFRPFAVVVSGSIIRGSPDPSSDFDIVVLHDEPWRQRVQKWFGGVPSEIFVNSVDMVKSYFEQESKAGRPVMAHMLATGSDVFSNSPVTEEIVAMAKANLERGPHFTEMDLNQQRYLAACLFEDAFETRDRDPVTAVLILGRAIDSTIKFWYSARQRFVPRSKEQLDVIRIEAPETAALIDRASVGSLDVRMTAARMLAEEVIQSTGFFEWDSGRGEARNG